MTTNEELDRLPTNELHDRAVAIAKRRMDVGFLWDLVKALPVAEEIAGDDQRAKTDIVRPLALLNELLYNADEGSLGEALRPLYIDYLQRHDGGEADASSATDGGGDVTGGDGGDGGR